MRYYFIRKKIVLKYCFYFVMINSVVKIISWWRFCMINDIKYFYDDVEKLSKVFEMLN